MLSELAGLPASVDGATVVSVRDNPGDQQVRLRFPNGFGVSIIRGSLSYGGQDGLFELAVLVFDGHQGRITYDTPITDNVLGWLSPAEVTETCREIAALPQRHPIALEG